MITFKRFLPSSDSRAGLKDDITFAASDLSPFEPNSTTVPAFDEGLTSFHSLTDIEATKEVQNQGAILYVNVDPNAPTAKITIDNLNLIPATQQQVISEIQRVAELRKEVRNKLSSFVSINIDEKQILTSSTQFSRFSAIDLFLSKKGDILDVATELSSYQGLLPTTFTNFVIGTTQKYAQVIEIVDKNKVKVDKIAGFVVNGYFTMANPKYFAQGAIRSDFLAAHNSYPPRDVQFFKIAAIDSNTKIITLVETYLSPEITSPQKFPFKFQALTFANYDNITDGDFAIVKNTLGIEYAVALTKPIAEVQTLFFQTKALTNHRDYVVVKTQANMSYAAALIKSTADSIYSIAEVQTLTFPTFASIIDGDYIVIENTLGIKYAVYADKTGSSPAPIGANYLAANYKIKADISTTTTAAQVASVFELAFNSLINFTTSIITNDTAANGTMTLTQVLKAPVTNPISKNQNDTAIGTILGVETIPGFDALAPTGALYASIVPTNKILVDISSAITSVQVALLVEQGLKSLTGFSSSIQSTTSLSTGEITLIQLVKGPTDNPTTKNVDDTTMGTIIGTQIIGGVSSLPPTGPLYSAATYKNIIDISSVFIGKDIASLVESTFNSLPDFVNSIKTSKVEGTLIFTYNMGHSTDDLVVKNKTESDKGSIITTNNTTDAFLFSTPEIQSVNEDKDLIVAYAGAPILYSYHHLPAALPLLDAQTFIEGEIPVTKIYLPKSKKNPDATYIGNLKRESLDVLMYDDDTEVFLVKAGEAQPSVSVSYKLLTEKDSTNYGDVEVKIKLESYPAKVQTEGVANVGATAIRLSAKMAIVPVRLLDSSLEKTKLNNGTVNKRTNQPNISKSDKRTDGEFYFSYQTRLPTGQIVNLNKYGTIRVKDRINIYDPSGNILSNNVIKTVDIENSLIILEKPLGVTLASRSIIEIPQTPFNPGRKYSISISATDKLGVASGYQQFKFTTKSLPQTKGTDGAHWEKIPLASFPPSLDLSIPDSFANAVAFSVANLTDSWSNLNDTLLATTANLQDLSCSVGSLIDGLKGAQNFATSFAQKNNNTQIYVRQVGLDPLGVINSQQSFMNQVNQILNDTGTSVGQIPRLTPAEVPLDPIAIANALGSGGTVVDNAFGGITTLGGSSGKALDALGISASIGLDFKKLSNDSSFRNGFGTSSIEYKVLTIIKKSTTNAEVSVETKVTLPLGSFTITNSKTDHNNGTFSTKNANDITTVSSLGKNITTLKYKNSLATTEFNSTAKLTVSGSQKIKAAEVVRVALEQEGLYGTKVSKKTISISELLDILIKHNIVGVNPETLEDDRSIATERLVRIAGNNPQRIGGILFVGKAPNLPALARKAKVLSNTMVWLKPLTDTISASLVASAANASGISYDPSNLDLTKLESQSNIANQDAYAAREKLEKTGVLNYQMPTLNINKDNPTDTNFTAWRHYSPVQLLPSLQAFGSLVDSKVSNFLGEGTLKASNGLSKGTSFLTGLIEGGQSGLQSGMNKLEGFSNVINSVTDDMNQLNKDITDGINFLKNLAGTGPISMEGHLIGAKLTLQSNQEYVESVKGSINDTTDPNRPTFGNSPTPSTLDAQNRIRSATTGTPSSNNTALWFGIVLVVIGKDKQDLGEQLHVLTDLLAMDGSAIALPAKPKLTFSGLKI